ncbi:MAG: short-chain dehydrogenase, partial [bacterium]
GIPILLSDGKTLLRGPEIKIPYDPRRDKFPITPESVEKWAHQGWVDLRIANFQRWQERFQHLVKDLNRDDETDSSSRRLRDRTFWNPEAPINIGEVVGWLLEKEDKGCRMK